MLKLILLSLLCIVPSVCVADVISDLRPCIRESAISYNVDPVLMEAIIRHESANGKSNAARTKNNLAGVMKRQGGLRRFNSKEECIAYLGDLLNSYHKRGLTDINRIARRYAPNKKSEWIRHINLYMNQIKAGKWGRID